MCSLKLRRDIFIKCSTDNVQQTFGKLSFAIVQFISKCVVSFAI